MKPKPIYEDKPWTTVIAGVRHPARSRDEAVAIGERERLSWAALGYKRSFKVVYRDGSEENFASEALP